MMIILAADIGQYVTLGDLLVVAVSAALIVFLVQRDRRNLFLKQIQVVVDELKDLNRDHESRLRATEDAVVRLVAIQERHDLEINGIKHRHSMIDEGRAVERRKVDRTYE